jgi:hypothetical protein
MDIITSLVNFIKNNSDSKKDEVPEGYCPNCWGRQEYGGNFYKAVLNHGSDIKIKSPNVGWIQDYADKYLFEISLKKVDDKMICPNCKVQYKEK